MSNQILPWIIFNIFVLGMLILDLWIFHHKAHVIKIKESLVWTAVWIILALFFNLGIYFWCGQEKAIEFLTGYLIEKSLSIDNIFIFLLIFSYFRVPSLYQHKILFWGIFSALIMRTIFIALGITLIQKFYWISYIFGGFLVFTGIKMALQKDKDIHPERNLIIGLFRRFMPITESYEEGKFFIKKEGRYFATLLFIVLLTIEITNIIFAIDSIPAIIAITSDFFIIYTSNVFAMLGLRALYFTVAETIQLFHFHYLRYGFSAIFVFVGIKMLLADYYKIPIGIVLCVIASILLVSMIVSVVIKKGKDEKIG